MLKGRMSSKPRMWSAWAWVRRMASRRSRPTRSACWRKSGVVSITTFSPLREGSREGRRRLSWGSFEGQTRHWQVREGTPMDAPAPSTVTFIGAAGMPYTDWIETGGDVGEDSGRWRRGRGVGGVGGVGGGWRGRGLCRLAPRFPLFLLDNFFAQFAFGGEGAAVDDAKSFFSLVVRQGRFLRSLYFGILALGCWFG